VIELHLLNHLFVRRFLQNLMRRRFLGERVVPCRTRRRGVRVSTLEIAFCVSDERVHELSLPPEPIDRPRRYARSRPSLSFPTGPEMIRGVRASSMRTESTSSKIAYHGRALHPLLERHHHVVAEVVEPELVLVP